MKTNALVVAYFKENKWNYTTFFRDSDYKNVQKKYKEIKSFHKKEFKICKTKVNKSYILFAKIDICSYGFFIEKVVNYFPIIYENLFCFFNRNDTEIEVLKCELDDMKKELNTLYHFYNNSNRKRMIRKIKTITLKYIVEKRETFFAENYVRFRNNVEQQNNKN